MLPKYRGRYSLVHSIANGEKYAGLTSHWIGKEIDLGDIISKKELLSQKMILVVRFIKNLQIVPLKNLKKIFLKIITGKKIKNL